MELGRWITFIRDWSSGSLLLPSFSSFPLSLLSFPCPLPLHSFSFRLDRYRSYSSLLYHQASTSCFHPSLLWLSVILLIPYTQLVSSRTAPYHLPFTRLLGSLAYNRQTGDLPRLAKPAAWLKTRFDMINKTCPQFMRPKYFALTIVSAYKAARKAVVEQCSEFISSGHSFTHDLALAAVQQYGLVKSASIDPAKPVPSLAAGLPHFAAGWARCWGRDVVRELPSPLAHLKPLCPLLTPSSIFLIVLHLNASSSRELA